MQRAKFTIAQEIDHDPVFNWCIKHILKKRDRIVASVRKQLARYSKWSHKFGTELPKIVEQAQTLDAKNDNIFWEDAITKESEYVKVHLRPYQMGQGHP